MTLVGYRQFAVAPVDTTPSRVMETNTSASTASGFSIVVGPPTQLYFVGSLAIQVERIDGEYLASEPRTGMYGEGDTDREALIDLFRSMVALRDDLRAHQTRLAPELAADLAFLERNL